MVCWDWVVSTAAGAAVPAGFFEEDVDEEEEEGVDGAGWAGFLDEVVVEKADFLDEEGNGRDGRAALVLRGVVFFSFAGVLPCTPPLRE